jgi:hypothetical protein
MYSPLNGISKTTPTPLVIVKDYRMHSIWNPTKTRLGCAFTVLVATLVIVGDNWAQEENSFQMGEGGEVVVTRGFVVKEIFRNQTPLPLIAVGSESGHHYLYDPNQVAMVGFWLGQFGRVNASGNFVPSDGDIKSFSLDRAPWSYGEKPRIELESSWLGYEIREGEVWFRYRLDDPTSDLFWEVEESLEIVTPELQRIHFTIKPSAETDLYLNYWLHQTDFRRVSTNGQQNQRNLLKNLFPNQTNFTISFYRRKERSVVPHGYTVESIPIPTPKPPFRFEPTDIDFGPDGEVYTSHRTGQVWRRQNGQWSLFADGLHEANGVRISADGKGIYVMQRPELTYLEDTDGDGIADLYRTVEDRFRYTGNYHEFAYGPRINSNGDMFFSTGLSANAHFSAEPNGYPNQMTSALGYRGWVMKRSKDGSLIPFASGLRSPAGIGMNEREELFITDNQGDWVASSYLGHVEEGDFMGHPASLWDRPEYGLTPLELDYNTVESIPEKVPPLDKDVFSKFRKRPAVWLAHVDLTNAPGHPSFAPKTGFGPFAGQAFIADIAHRNIVRVALDKVDGEYQGAVFPFIRPLSSSSYSTAFDPEGNLWVGSVGRGWTAGDPAMEIIRFHAEETPFEIQRIELTRKGFDIHFTQALSSESLQAEDLFVSEYEYHYWDGYGSEPLNEKNVPIKSLKKSSDGMKLSLELPLREAAIYQIELPELKAASGLVLENNFGIYTLNRLLP